jgi:hypothetical protein
MKIIRVKIVQVNLSKLEKVTPGLVIHVQDLPGKPLPGRIQKPLIVFGKSSNHFWKIL